MIQELKNLNLPDEDIKFLEQEFDCQISRNPMSGWWCISTPVKNDMPLIFSWINALKAGAQPKLTDRSARYGY